MIRTFLAALLLTASPVAAQTPKQVGATPEIKPVAFTQRTLANGLRVYAIRDTTTANVAVQVWYDVGGRDDPRGRSGFAHLFEHLMFKATRNLVPEQFDRLTEDVGGYNNASTGDDYTKYFELVPANHLERMLFAEADRMASLVVEPKSFASERDVVKEEYRQGVLSQPYGKLEGYLAATAYTRHPYARGVIGSIQNLDAATIDDVRAFHAIYYRPDNAVLVVAGNFDPAALDAWVDRYFAKIARPAQPIPRVAVAEPPRDAPVAYTVHEPNTPLPAVALSYPVPPDRDPDVPALMVLDAILSRGDSSRLYQALVYRSGLAQSAETTLDTRAGPGVFNVIAIAAGGKDSAAVEAALRAELARVRDTPVTVAELAEAKTEIVTSALKGLETAEGKARMIAASVLIDGDPRATERQLAAVGKITAADVQRVARTYLAERRSAVIRYLPVAAAGAKPDADIAIADTVVTRALDTAAKIAIVTPAPADQRAALPALGTPAEPTTPVPVTATLANGLKLITIERHDVPLVSARLVAFGGAVRDAPGKAGTASLAAQLLTKGTATRSATQIASEAEALGASLDSGADRDGATLAITVGTPAIEPALAILADAARHPALAADELERLRAQAIDGVAVAMSEPSQVAALTADRALFGASPYGAPVGGTAMSLKAITPADIRAAYRATWTPGGAALILVGDVTPTRARTLAEAAFGAWKGSAPAAVEPLLTTSVAPRVIVIDMPDAGQAGVVVINPGVARSDATYFPALLAGTVLGGGFSSRLNTEIRIKRGLSYGAGTELEAYRAAGAVTSGTRTKNASAPAVVSLIAAEMARLGQAAPSAVELDSRKSVLTGQFGRGTETSAGTSAIVASQYLDGLNPEDLARYAPAVRAVDPQAIRAAAAKILDPAQASIVVAGDARQFVDALRKTYPNLEVIPAAALNLDTPALR